jgi:hypothetical protein
MDQGNHHLSEGSELECRLRREELGPAARAASLGLGVLRRVLRRLRSRELEEEFELELESEDELESESESESEDESDADSELQIL